MLFYLILLFTIIPVLELAVLIKVGTCIGAGNTILIVILTGVAGAYLARSQGILTLIKIQEDLNRGIMPGDKIVDGLMILCGGVMLLTPGLITDLIGFMALIPATRYLIKHWLKNKFKDMIDRKKIIRI
ncbi:MAG: FxsA family protein, partial [Candidatus Omnitrophica bacterium]|nr:FxsA family protein [Candidatus Omnitrophota bacterium]